MERSLKPHTKTECMGNQRGCEHEAFFLRRYRAKRQFLRVPFMINYPHKLSLCARGFLTIA